MKIVIDAMGGDHAPAAVIDGVIEALKTDEDLSVLLVGREDRIKSELARHTFPSRQISIIHAEDVIDMHDPATSALRKKKNSSISVGVRLLKENNYDAFISAGNTGAVVAASSFILGMLPGVERPAIGLVVPTLTGFAFLIDVGANTDPKPQHLLQTALMANVYIKEVLGVEQPKIALLNIGEEATKGPDFVKTIHKSMSEHLKNFIGNIEPIEMFNGKSDCIICDGYVGNMVIKVGQGLMESAAALMRREIKKSPVAILGALLMKSRLSHIKRLADYSEYGGAPLLGVNGLVMISHGRSSPKAIKNAIIATCREIQHNINTKMIKAVEDNQ